MTGPRDGHVRWAVACPSCSLGYFQDAHEEDRPPRTCGACGTSLRPEHVTRADLAPPTCAKCGGFPVVALCLPLCEDCAPPPGTCPECGGEDGTHEDIVGPDMPGEPGSAGYPGGGSRWPCPRAGR